MNRRAFLLGATALVTAKVLPSLPPDRWFIASCDFANTPDKTGITVMEYDFKTENMIVVATQRFHFGSDYMRAIYGSLGA